MTSEADTEQFRDNPLWERIRSALQTIEATRPRSQVDRHTKARALAVLRYLGEHRSISPYLFPSTRLAVADILTNQIDRMLAQIEGWDQDAGMLAQTVAQIDSECDQILASLTTSSWPTLQKESRARAISESAAAFQSAAESSLSAIESEVTVVDSRLQVLREEVAALTEEANSRQEESAAALEAIDVALMESETKAEKQLKQTLSLIQREWANLRDEQGSLAEASLAQLKTDASTGEKLVAFVGDQAVGGGYFKFARREMAAYWSLNGFGVFVAAFTFWFLQEAIKSFDTSDPALGLLKASVALTGAGLAAYAFREAGKRHRQSIEARYRALDLLAIRPFTNEMGGAQQEQLRYVLGERLFARPVDSLSPPSKADKTTTLKIDIDSVKTAIDTASKAKDLIQ